MYAGINLEDCSGQWDISPLAPFERHTLPPVGAGGNGDGWPGGGEMPPLSPGDTGHILSDYQDDVTGPFWECPDYWAEEEREANSIWDQIYNSGTNQAFSPEGWPIQHSKGFNEIASTTTPGTPLHDKHENDFQQHLEDYDDEANE